jgi:hypothetical protein
VFSIFRYGARWAPFIGGSTARARRVEPAHAGNLRTRQKQSTCHWLPAASRGANKSGANSTNDAFGNTQTPAVFETARLAVCRSRQRQRLAQPVAVRVEPESEEAET